VELQLIPEQPWPVVDAVAELLQTGHSASPAADPWWQAGIDEILEA
jgi:hypothetical protein